MSMVNEEQFNNLKSAVLELFSGYPYEYRGSPLSIYQPYSFAYIFMLKQSAWKLDLVSNNILANIFHADEIQDFIIKSSVKFEFYYTREVGNLADKYSVYILVSHLGKEIKKLFIYNTLGEFMKVLTEIFDIFKQNIVSGNTEKIDMTIMNFENYCAIAGL